MKALHLTSLVEQGEFWKKVLRQGSVNEWKKMLWNNNYDDDTGRNSALTLNNNEDESFEIEVSVAKSEFNQSMKDFAKLYCNMADPKVNLIDYIRSEEYRKPKNVAIFDHQERIKELLFWLLLSLPDPEPCKKR